MRRGRSRARWRQKRGGMEKEPSAPRAPRLLSNDARLSHMSSDQPTYLEVGVTRALVVEAARAVAGALGGALGERGGMRGEGAVGSERRWGCRCVRGVARGESARAKGGGEIVPGDIALNKAHVLSARAFAQAQAQGVGERVECGSAGADFGPLKFRGAVCGFARASGGAPKGPRVKCRRVTSPCVSYLGRGDGDDQSEGQATGEHRY